jgi:hypothetical protein
MYKYNIEYLKIHIFYLLYIIFKVISSLANFILEFNKLDNKNLYFIEKI